MHSASKYINGHSDIIGGMVVKTEEMAFLQNAVGAIRGSFDSYLALHGVKILPFA